MGYSELNKTSEATVCARSDDRLDLTSMIHDPLIQLVMDSDGVTEEAMIALVDRIRTTLASRDCEINAARGSRLICSI